jgi:NAD(P)-dependent dehydrogenase (short-subunit alcohol dehydrogenase family)
MSRIFISGSSTGLGMMEAELLVTQGHEVVLHARNSRRANDARLELPEAEAIVTGDFETVAGAKDVAQVNALGHFDAVMHNAAAGYREGHRVTADGLPHIFAINTLSAFILTAPIERPKRLVWNGSTAYAESKLHDAMLAMAVARLARRVLECAGAGLGSDQDGRSRRAR